MSPTHNESTALQHFESGNAINWILPWTATYYSPLELLYSRKLSREKNFTNFVVLWLFTKVFSAKFGAWRSLAQQKQAISESFFRKNRIFRQFTKVFSLESFPLYGTNTSLIRTIILVSRLWSLSIMIWTVVTSWSIPYSGKLSREKNFHEFRSVAAIYENFHHKIWGRGIIWQHQRAIRESFLCENHIFYQFTKFFSCEVSCCTASIREVWLQVEVGPHHSTTV